MTEATEMTELSTARDARTAPHPGPRAWLALTICEAKMTLRDISGMLVPIALPLLILLTSAPAASTEIIMNDRSALDLFVLPLVAAMVLAMIGVLNMPSFLAYYRRSGILRRLATTPLSPFMVLAAQMVVSLLQAIIGLGLAYGVAVLFFEARPPISTATALGVLGLSALAMYGAGMIVASLAPTPNAAIAIGLIGFLGLGALGGMFGGRDALPDWLAAIGEVLPFGASVEALTAAWAGQPVEALHLISLVVAAVLGAVVAALFFRWE